MSTKKLLRPKEAAQHFSISKMTLWRWQKSPGFPPPLRRGGVVLYDLCAVQAWLDGAQE